MKHFYHRVTGFTSLFLLIVLFADAQKNDLDSSVYYNQVKTYINPVLPGDHPDPTLLKVGDDFYHCGSSFHFTPYLPIYPSKDMFHWEMISRVVPPSKAGWVSDRPSEGLGRHQFPFLPNFFNLVSRLVGRHFDIPVKILQASMSANFHDQLNRRTN